jgi:hypothetical protein
LALERFPLLAYPTEAFVNTKSSFVLKKATTGLARENAGKPTAREDRGRTQL